MDKNGSVNLLKTPVFSLRESVKRSCGVIFLQGDVIRQEITDNTAAGRSVDFFNSPEYSGNYKEVYIKEIRSSMVERRKMLKMHTRRTL